MFINIDFTGADLYFYYKPCTRSKYRIGFIHVRDVIRLFEKGVYEYIYKENKGYRFIKDISLFLYT